MTLPPIFHQPSQETISTSAMTAFTHHCERLIGHKFPTYDALHKWSVTSPEIFWTALLTWSELIVGGDAQPGMVGKSVKDTRFFPKIALSYTENLLAGISHHPNPNAPAITAHDETGHVQSLSWAQLNEQVSKLACGLQAIGVKRGDKVVAVVRNSADAIVACLACTGLGATWASVAPDQGTAAILSRFVQVRPKWLVAHTSQQHGGLRHDLMQILKAIDEALPSLAGVLILDEETQPPLLSVPLFTRSDLEQPLKSEIRWEKVPFDHPLFILFSSGTMGVPKCIVHGTGGTLLQHIKEHRLHTDLGPKDTLYFHTTCGWMMWNWLISALAGGTHIVVYDGSVSYPTPQVLLTILEQEHVTVFGTSPIYLQYLELSGVHPSQFADLSALRLIQSTGAVLYSKYYDFVRDKIKDIPVHSISGGTDIVGCFVLGNPNLPVYQGESSCLALGMDVQVIEDGVIKETGTGELVCCTPFPSRPIAFHGDKEGALLHSAYFAENLGVWTHGDYIELTQRRTARVMGRSDGILNIKGVRIGPAEIYGALNDMEILVDVMALAQEDPDALGGRRLLLLIVLKEGCHFDRPLMWQIKRQIKTRCSVNHVPERIIAVPALPTTHSGKRSERATQDLLDGKPIRNLTALRNPEVLTIISDALKTQPPS